MSLLYRKIDYLLNYIKYQIGLLLFITLVRVGINQIMRNTDYHNEEASRSLLTLVLINYRFDD